MPPQVSVVICLHNSAPFIEETLHSVLGQTFTDFEVVLIDDGSADGCADLVQTRFRDPRVRLVRQAHRGLGATRQRSLDEASGEYIAFLDHDDLCLPHRLERQVALARQQPSAVLVFAECVYIDSTGAHLGRLSDQWHFDALDLSAPNVHHSLLTHGCFVELSTVLAHAATLRRAGGFNPSLQFVEDYDAWLRLSRHGSFAAVREPLVLRRLHERQFTRRHPDVALREHRTLLDPVIRDGRYPARVRRCVEDFLLGQHLETCRALLRQRRPARAAATALRAASLPAAGRRFVRDKLAGTHPLQRRVVVDATAVGPWETGYCNLSLELLRTLSRSPDVQLEAILPADGRSVLRRRLGLAASRIRVRQPRLFARDRAPSERPLPRRRGGLNTVEVMIWRHGFEYADSRKVAIIQDLTPRLFPDWHTAGNIAEFERFLGYVVRHADTILAPSMHTRRDVLAHLSVAESRVMVMPMPIDPAYRAPVIRPSYLGTYGLTPSSYVLCVGTIEPRKNLRRLVRVFAGLRRQFPWLQLVLAGQPGWDEPFGAALERGDFGPSVRWLGFVPHDHLPALYRHASAVVYPSLYEGFGLPVMEALCCSSLVMASNVSSIPEILGDAGWYCDPHDEASMHAALGAILALDPLAALAARDRSRFRADALLDRWEAEPLLPGLPAAARHRNTTCESPLRSRS